MYRVLFITSDPTNRKPLKSGLLEQGFGVSMVETQELMKESFAPGKADVLVMDVERSPVEPHKLCHVVKQDRALKEVPLVLLLTEDQLGRVDFSWGVDDYLTLPVSVKRLGERIRFLMWKRNKVELKNGLKLGGLAIDFERYEVHSGGELVDLTYKEFELLKFLATHPGRVFSREALLDKVWGYDYYGGTRTVDVHVRRLRSKIETGGDLYIQTVRNVGYKFVGEPD
jgi:DNA-binding response OmpR family regulator